MKCRNFLMNAGVMYAFKKSNYEANCQLNVVQRLFVHLKFGTETFRHTLRKLTSAESF